MELGGPRGISRLIYMDDSGDPQTGLAVLGWIQMAPWDWADVLGSWLAHRKRLDQRYSIPVSKELHMTDFVLGRGRIARSLPSEFISSDGQEQWKLLGEVVAIEGLETMASCRGLEVGAVYRHGEPKRLHATKHDLYSDWLAELEQTLEATGELALVFMDGDGTEKDLRRAHRELPRMNRHIIEDPVFLDSRTSQLVQMADHVAWSANSSLMQVPKHKFAHGWYSQYLAIRDPFRGPRQIAGSAPENS